MARFFSLLAFFFVTMLSLIILAPSSFQSITSTCSTALFINFMLFSINSYYLPYKFTRTSTKLEIFQNHHHLFFLFIFYKIRSNIEGETLWGLNSQLSIGFTLFSLCSSSDLWLNVVIPPSFVYLASSC